MFSILDQRSDHNCQGYSRREFLKIGSLGFGGLSLANLLAANASAANEKLPTTDKSVVLLFLSGGPPHIEFFDPKMSAPVDYRSITGEVPTRLKGVTFGGTFPRIANIADQIAVVRSYASNNSGHTYLKVTSGDNDMQSAMGALYSRVAGINNRETGMPTNALILPEAIDPKLKLGSNFETKALSTLTSPGRLGPSYGAFNPAGGGTLKQNMQMRIKPARLEDRRGLLRSLDRMRRNVDASGIMESADTFQQQAFDVITRGAADAFDLSKEDPATVARYDTSKLFDARKLRKWYDMRRATNLLGKQMLMARRLLEAGCRFVTVSDCGWDYHANNNSPKNMAGIYPMGGQVDHAVSAFIEDLHDRGLSENVLLIVTGEMGRSPRINKNGGRDHYGNLTSLLLAGGGLKMGQVIGESDRTASEPATKPYGPQHLLATVMHTLFDVGEARISRKVPGDVARVITSGKPIAELF